MAVLSFYLFITLVCCSVSLCFLISVHGGDFIPERVCGTLYSQNDFRGDSFTMNDFDFSADTGSDYRATISGWLNTRSVRVEKECSMYVCSETNFQGTCHMLNENISHPSPFISQVRSTNCTCARECNCQDIIGPKHQYVRMYLKGDCQLCDTEYLSPWFSLPDFEVSQSIQTFRIRRGCNLTLYGDKDYKGDSSMHSEEIIENNFNTFQSYTVSCNDSAYSPSRRQPKAVSDPPQINLPDTSQGLLQLVSTNDSMAKHPGIQAALKSLQNGRTWKNAYILVLGTNQIQYFLKEDGCAVKHNRKISECRISQPLDKLGISNSEIRIIYYDWTHGLPDKEEDDFQLMASLDEYLSNHEELKYAIPNAVVLQWNASRPKLLLQRQLQIINAIRTRVINDGYSNLIFYFSLVYRRNFRSENTNVADIVKEINSNWTFPKPISVMPDGNQDTVGGYSRYVNGFTKMLNGEYFPLNFLQRLRVSCRGSGDALGEAIFSQMYIETGNVRKVINLESEVLSKNHSLVEYYRRCSMENSVSACTNATERPQPVSQFTDQAAINHKMLQSFAGLHVKFQKVEGNLSKLKSSTDENIERIKNELMGYIRVLETKVSDLENSSLLTQVRLNGSETLNIDLGGKLSQQSNILENLNSQIQRLEEQLADSEKSREQEKAMSDERHTNSVERIRKLEEELAEIKSSRDADAEKIKNEAMAYIRVNLNKLFE